MKKVFLTLAIVFFLFSCDDGDMENTETNPFVGTWENYHSRYVFTNATIASYALNDGEILWYSGTYTYNDNYH